MFAKTFHSKQLQMKSPSAEEPAEQQNKVFGYGLTDMDEE